MDWVTNHLLVVGGALLVGGFGLYRMLRSDDGPPARKRPQPPGRRPGRLEVDGDDGFDFDADDGEGVADAFVRMADRYENAGDTQAAAHAREAAEHARSHADGGTASQAASDYLASVGATDVAGAWSALDSSSGNDGGGSGASEGGGASGSYSDNT